MKLIVEYSKENNYLSFWLPSSGMLDCGDYVFDFLKIRFSFYKKDNPWKITVNKK